MQDNANTIDLLIKNTWVLSEDFVAVPGMAVAVAGGKITDVLPTGQAEGLAAAQVIDGTDKLVMPGLVDAHTHVCQQFLRGRVLDQLPMIWTRIMLPYESTLTPEASRLSAELACLEMIKSGTTFFADAGGRHMDQVAQTALESGLRASLTCSTMDEGGEGAAMVRPVQECLDENNDLYDRWNGAGDGRISVAYSLRSMLSCSQELTLRVFETAAEKGALVHAHMSEYPNEVNNCLERHQKRPFSYLAELGVLGPRFLAAHCLLLSEKEEELIAASGTKVVHSPFSNCGKAVPNTPALLQRGVPVGLGTDGAAHGGLSLWSEMKIFRSVMNACHGAFRANPVVMPAKTLLRMATKGGAEVLNQGEKLGSLAPGKQADFITINLAQPHILPSGNLTNSLLEVVTAGDVADMVVAGRLVMRDRLVLTLDEEKILAESRGLCQRLF